MSGDYQWFPGSSIVLRTIFRGRVLGWERRYGLDLSISATTFSYANQPLKNCKKDELLYKSRISITSKTSRKRGLEGNGRRQTRSLIYLSGTLNLDHHVGFSSLGMCGPTKATFRFSPLLLRNGESEGSIFDTLSLRAIDGLTMQHGLWLESERRSVII